MEKQGILLVNLGTPDQPEKKAVRAYLKIFLSDRNVIDYPRWFWLPLLHLMILNVRPKKSAELYKNIWLKEGSPLKLYTEIQTEKLQKLLPEKKVSYAMSYSKPMISEALKKMSDQGIEDITIIPLYPQYSTTTTFSVYQDVVAHYTKERKLPTFHFINDFHQHPLYIQIMADEINYHLAEKRADAIVLSYHGIPESYVAKGDPYYTQCMATTEKVKAEIKQDIPVYASFQSKFGPAEWLKPSTENTMKKLPQEGKKKILVLTPGFVADCLETIDEVDREYREVFIENGGEEMTYIHPMNEKDEFVQLLKQIATQ